MDACFFLVPSWLENVSLDCDMYIEKDTIKALSRFVVVSNRRLYLYLSGYRYNLYRALG